MEDPKIKIKQTDLLSDNWYILNKVTFDFLKKDGKWVTQKREVYDRGNGAGILLYNREQKQSFLPVNSDFLLTSTETKQV